MPAWAERAGQTTWHPHHIAERYALLTIIVLGESILAATIAIDAALLAGSHPTALASTIVGGLLTVFSMWWIYFDRPAHDLLTTMRRAFVWGYGHLVVFASAAAVGAGLAVTIDQITGHATIGTVAAGLSVTVPVVTFMLSLWVLHNRAAYRRTRWVAPVAAPLILATSFTGHATLATGLILAAIVAYKTTTGGLPRRRPTHTDRAGTGARPETKLRGPTPVSARSAYLNDPSSTARIAASSGAWASTVT